MAMDFEGKAREIGDRIARASIGGPLLSDYFAEIIAAALSEAYEAGKLCQASAEQADKPHRAEDGALQSDSEWHSIATAPNYPILGWCRVSHVRYEGPAVIWREDGKWYGGPSGIIGFEVLAWKELPSPPLKSLIEERSDDEPAQTETLA